MPSMRLLRVRQRAHLQGVAARGRHEQERAVRVRQSADRLHGRVGGNQQQVGVSRSVHRCRWRRPCPGCAPAPPPGGRRNANERRPSGSTAMPPRSRPKRALDTRDAAVTRVAMGPTLGEEACRQWIPGCDKNPTAGRGWRCRHPPAGRGVVHCALVTVDCEQPLPRAWRPFADHLVEVDAARSVLGRSASRRCAARRHLAVRQRVHRAAVRRVHLDRAPGRPAAA